MKVFFWHVAVTKGTDDPVIERRLHVLIRRLCEMAFDVTRKIQVFFFQNRTRFRGSASLRLFDLSGQGSKPKVISAKNLVSRRSLCNNVVAIFINCKKSYRCEIDQLHKELRFTFDPSLANGRRSKTGRKWLGIWIQFRQV